MEQKKMTQEQMEMLKEPLPAKALKPHPTKAFLTTINSIYVTERLNKVFGVGAWQVASEIVTNTEQMVVVKTTLTIPEYGIRYECYGGNDNKDKGDAHKGAVTDAITKIGSWMGIGAEVWKNEAGKATAKPTPAPAPAPRKVISDKTLDNREQCERMLKMLEAEREKQGASKRDFSPVLTLKDMGFEFETGADIRVADIWFNHISVGGLA